MPGLVHITRNTQQRNLIPTPHNRLQRSGYDIANEVLAHVFRQLLLQHFGEDGVKCGNFILSILLFCTQAFTMPNVSIAKPLTLLTCTSHHNNPFQSQCGTCVCSIPSAMRLHSMRQDALKSCRVSSFFSSPAVPLLASAWAAAASASAIADCNTCAGAKRRNVSACTNADTGKEGWRNEMSRARNQATPATLGRQQRRVHNDTRLGTWNAQKPQKHFQGTTSVVPWRPNTPALPSQAPTSLCHHKPFSQGFYGRILHALYGSDGHIYDTHDSVSSYSYSWQLAMDMAKCFRPLQTGRFPASSKGVHSRQGGVRYGRVARESAAMLENVVTNMPALSMQSLQVTRGTRCIAQLQVWLFASRPTASDTFLSPSASSRAGKPWLMSRTCMRTNIPHRKDNMLNNNTGAKRSSFAPTGVPDK